MKELLLAVKQYAKKDKREKKIKVLLDRVNKRITLWK